MKLSRLIPALLMLAACSSSQKEVTMSTDTLLDKIMGGWAGQTIGVVYGAPTEFKHQGTLIPDNQPISWGE